MQIETCSGPTEESITFQLHFHSERIADALRDLGWKVVLPSGRQTKDALFVDDRPYPVEATLDALRFVGNRIVGDLLDVASNHGLGLNDIQAQIRDGVESLVGTSFGTSGRYSRNELRELYRPIGCTVTDYSKTFPKDIIKC